MMPFRQLITGRSQQHTEYDLRLIRVFLSKQAPNTSELLSAFPFFWKDSLHSHY